MYIIALGLAQRSKLELVVFVGTTNDTPPRPSLGFAAKHN